MARTFGTAIILVTLLAARADALVSQSSGATNSTPIADDVARLVTLHQQARAEHGLGAFTVSPTLVSIATERSRDMARAFAIWHDYDIGHRFPSGHVVGENVGRGPTVDDVFVAFMNSPEHRSNILARDFSSIGIAVTNGDDGDVYVEVLFLTGSIDAPAAATGQPRLAAEPTPPEHAVTMLVELVAMDAA
jgi:uncharacterized protein YkwD